MDFTIDDIFTKVCELEGLLAALRQYGDNLPEATLAALKRKADEVARLVNEIPEPKPTEKTIKAPAPIVEEEKTIEVPEPVIEEETTVEEAHVPVIEEAPAPIVEEEPAVMPPVFNPQASEKSAPAVAETMPAEPLRVSDKLHRTISKDLRRALSLNDRFRFARELFGNSVPKLDNALTAIEDMGTLEEAEAYLLGDLGLNAEDETAAEFMTIVKNHFL